MESRSGQAFSAGLWVREAEYLPAGSTHPPCNAALHQGPHLSPFPRSCSSSCAARAAGKPVRPQTASTAGVIGFTAGFMYAYQVRWSRRRPGFGRLRAEQAAPLKRGGLPPRPRRAACPTRQAGPVQLRSLVPGQGRLLLVVCRLIPPLMHSWLSSVLASSICARCAHQNSYGRLMGFRQ